MPADTPLSVSALTRRLALDLEGYGVLLVQGELSQVKVASSGHLYATLKDGEAIIGLAMWRSSVVRQGALPSEGQQVLVRGSLSLYAPRGTYQLIATRITPVGQGDLAARFLALKNRLLAEGLFDDERKLPLPLLPRAVGLATATGSAALADLLHSIRARFPTMPVVHAPCLVQGPQAAASIVAAIKALDAHPEVDVIIVGRGGGSLEDLWAFNEERTVRAIAACRTPIVAAVGHETDTTLADLAADLRAKTPTAAGELVVPVLADLHAQLTADRTTLDRLINELLADRRDQLAALATHRALSGPGYQVRLRQQRLDELAERLEALVDAALSTGHHRLALEQGRLHGAAPDAALATAARRHDDLAARLTRAVALTSERHGTRLATLAGRLDAFSPLGVLARGYSVVRTPQHRLVRQLADAPDGATIETRLTDGWLTATVTGRRRQGLAEPDEGYQA